MNFFVFVAIVMAAFFAWRAWTGTHRALPLAATLLWLIYAVYERQMVNGNLCSGDCNIRVDLVLIFPLLLAVTLVAMKRNPSPFAVKSLGIAFLVLIALATAALGFYVAALIAAAGAVALGFYRTAKRTSEPGPVDEPPKP